MKHRKYPLFPLTSQSGRMALLLGIRNGHVTMPELEAAILQDSLPRPHRKPVVAEGQRFASVTDAAHWLYRTRPELSARKPGVMAGQAAGIMRLQKRIARMATQDCWEGYYWSE